jgi:tetratricopeptide (TPR) repeat protein
MKKFLFTISLVFAFSLGLLAQEDKNQALARQYFQNGDFQKAAELYEQLYKKEPANFFYYNSLFTSYLRLNDYKSAEDLVKKQQKRYKTDVRYTVDLGYIYSQDNQAKKAEQTFEEAISNLSANENEIRMLAGKFMSYRQDDYVVKTYLKGNQLFGDNSKFAFDLGNAYIRANKPTEAVDNWLIVIDRNPIMMQSIQNMIANNIEVKRVQEALETKLYNYIQKHPGRNDFAEMLIWLFTHQKDYDGALVQAKALDKRNNEDGWRIMNLANNAMREELYDAAINAYKYLLTKGEQSVYYRSAQSEILRARKLKVTTGKYTSEDITVLQKAYSEFLDKYGKTPQNAQTIRDLANLEAKYLFNLDKAVELLEALIAYPQLQKRTRSESKLDLGDYYLQMGDVWEATLLYSQVDKDEKDSPLGEDARYRNARLSYFKGEFEWAQAQLNILKGATSELIANDALKLSVFIMDNLGLDTSTTAMKIYADAELLHMQNKNKEALAKLDVILRMFPQHALTDDVLYKKAKIYYRQKEYSEAVAQLEVLVKNHADDILADDAFFMLGEIYQFHLNDETKAMEYYRIIITDYTDSVLLTEARKRFRKLRGDDV